MINPTWNWKVSFRYFLLICIVSSLFVIKFSDDVFKFYYSEKSSDVYLLHNNKTVELKPKNHKNVKDIDSSFEQYSFDDFSPQKVSLFKNVEKFNFKPFRWCLNGEDISSEIEFPFDCEKLFDDSETKKNVESAQQWKPSSLCSYEDEIIEQWLEESCDNYLEKFGFVNKRIVPLDFPLAYVMVAHKSAEQFSRLLQAIYHPENAYCIAYDSDSPEPFRRALHKIASCLPNIIMPKKHVNINWAGFSILNSMMNCLEVLRNGKLMPIQWRYVQFLSWNDFPLRTNDEMIRIFQIFNGSQDSELSTAQSERYVKEVHEGVGDWETNIRKPLPPGHFVPYKGSMAVSLSRRFVEFVFRNPAAQKLYRWSNTTMMAEEQFWSTLVHNPQSERVGGYPGTCIGHHSQDKVTKPYISRFQIWYSGCGGEIVAGSCVYGVKDLPLLTNAPHLVAHKFYLTLQPAAYYCLAWAHHRRRQGKTVKNYPALNLTFYETLPSVLYQNLPADQKETFQCQ